jgi:hypothetical protein
LLTRCSTADDEAATLPAISKVARFTKRDGGRVEGHDASTHGSINCYKSMRELPGLKDPEEEELCAY